MGAWFIASFPQRDGCAQCGADIDEGDKAGYVDDEVCCEECWEEENQEEVLHPSDSTYDW